MKIRGSVVSLSCIFLSHLPEDQPEEENEGKNYDRCSDFIPAALPEVRVPPGNPCHITSHSYRLSYIHRFTSMIRVFRTHATAVL